MPDIAYRPITPQLSRFLPCGPVHASYPVAAFARDGLLVAWLEHEGTSATVRVSRQR